MLYIAITATLMLGAVLDRSAESVVVVGLLLLVGVAWLLGRRR